MFLWWQKPFNWIYRQLQQIAAEQDMSKHKHQKTKSESFSLLEDRAKKLEALINLSNNIRDLERRQPLPFNDFLYLAAEKPESFFRDIFQLFYDMIHYFVPRGKESFKGQGELTGFLEYDCSKLFVQGCDNPYFADRLFANRLLQLIHSFKKGTQNNHIYLFEGPPGSGKSTFLNNLLYKLEEFTKLPEGAIYKIFWRLDIKKLGGFQKVEKKFHEAMSSENHPHDNENLSFHLPNTTYPHKYLEFSCPNHDHPILMIPKAYRKQFLNELIHDEKFKKRLFSEKEFEWVLKDIPCHICNSLYNSLLDILGDPLEVFNMISARKNYYNRQFGEGISIFNPGDQQIRHPFTNTQLQHLINSLLKEDDVKFIFSDLAKTNNGVLALMDIKEFNIERLKNLHGVISDGVHKVELLEERIKTLFVGLVNPEDKVHYEKIKSFQDRIITVKVPYILDYRTEVTIYKNKFGEDLENKFLPGVLENVARIFISSRLNKDSSEIRGWITQPGQYQKFVDDDLLLLKMDLYTGKIPGWISEEDVKKFDPLIRKAILAASEEEGAKGFSGRQALTLFFALLSKYEKGDKLITMDMVCDFFSQKDDVFKEIPTGFLDSLHDLYDYGVLQEVKEAIYYYNENQIKKGVSNYLFAINYEIGEKHKSPYTDDIVEIDSDFFKDFELVILGKAVTDSRRAAFRQETLNEYISRTLSQEIRLDKLELSETSLFKNLMERYTKNLKENSLAQYAGNENFRRAILDYNTPGFNSYDEKLKRDIKQLIGNLKQKFKYSTEGARQAAVYVIDKKLYDKY